MIFRLFFVCFISVIAVSCAQEVIVEDDSACIQISGESPGAISNLGYIVTVRSGLDAVSVANEYVAEYGGAFDWFDGEGSSFNVNINESAIVRELRCDSRIERIEYDSIPKGTNGP